VRKFEFDGLDEANVAAEFYHQCRLIGLRVYLEVPAFSPVHRSRSFKVDCIVRDGKDGDVLCAIEFKAANARPSGEGRQSSAYASLGLPWRYCIGQKQVRETIAWVRSLQKKEAA
jgi:hypothetical protein